MTDSMDPRVSTPTKQLVRWARLDNEAPGIFIEDFRVQTQILIPWSELKSELETMLLPQVRMIPERSVLELRNLDDKRDWLVRVVAPSGETIASLWLGADPDSEWKWDGFVRVGEPGQHSTRDRNVWQVFQRYSDGSYRLQKAIRAK